MKPANRRCAIYTRKSSEEGLEQDFNSLNAQREACLSYIASQKSEGWKAIHEYYDDGGFSGGNMDRPALTKLIGDIQAGRVDIIVVYKIDRLTRSLMDFSRLVEIFDRHGVTFVSITQSFNTTTSMGRLTLNVLLSFAQFEREVTGERIRDKVAASKKKGMWMGGTVPIGYRCEERRLVIDPEGQKMVEYIFEQYAALKSVKALKEKLDRAACRTPYYISRKGIRHGGVCFSRGHLYRILANPIYIGKIRHKDHIHDGQHQAIIDDVLWERARQILARNTISTCEKTCAGSLLKGKLYDGHGHGYSPSFAVKRGKRYRYYVSQVLLQYRDKPQGVTGRISAHEIESKIEELVRSKLASIAALASLMQTGDEAYPDLRVISERHLELDVSQIFGVIRKVMILPGQLIITLDLEKLRKTVAMRFQVALPSGESETSLTMQFKTFRARIGALIIQPETQRKDLTSLPSAQLKRLVQGIAWRNEHFKGKTMRAIAGAAGCSEAFVAKLISSSLDIRCYR